MYKDTTNSLGICLFLLHYFKTLLKILNLIMHSQWEKQQGFQNILKFFAPQFFLLVSYSNFNLNVT